MNPEADLLPPTSRALTMQQALEDQRYWQRRAGALASELEMARHNARQAKARFDRAANSHE